MKKRLLSLLLVLAVVFSFSLSAFATDTGIDIIDDPLSYYFENQMLGVQKGTGVTLVCPKCDYKVVYTGGTLVTCPHDGEALVLSDLAGVHAEKFTPGGGSTSGGGIGRKDLPGFEDEKGTAQVSKEGKLTYVVHPRLLLNSGSLSVPYQNFYSDAEDTLTVTIVAMDELSVQMNSRSFKDNFNAYFLNTLLCCRHYHISFYGSAQRFQHVDKLLRDVTHTVIQCNKVWRFQLWASYDAWEMENATNAEMIKPLRRGLWFVLDRDYNAYDTLAVVDNLQKKFEEGDILTESEIISNQAPAGPLGLEVASKPTKKAQRRISGQIKR